MVDLVLVYMFFFIPLYCYYYTYIDRSVSRFLLVMISTWQSPLELANQVGLHYVPRASPPRAQIAYPVATSMTPVDCPFVWPTDSLSCSMTPVDCPFVWHTVCGSREGVAWGWGRSELSWNVKRQYKHAPTCRVWY